MMPRDSSDITRDADLYGSTRRVFHLAVVYVLGAIIGLAMAIPTALYLLVPPKARTRSGWIDAGDISQLKPGVPVELSFQENRLDGWRSVDGEEDGVGGQGGRQQSCRLRPAVHASRLRLPLGDASGQVRLSLPRLGFLDRGQSARWPRAAPARPVLTKIENNRLQIGELKQSV